MIGRMIPLALLVATACAAAPVPVPVPPAGAKGPFAALPAASIAPVPDDWWRLYDDPALDALVAASLAANADLRVAYANLDASRAALRQAHAAQLPQIKLESGLTVDGTRAQPSASSVSSTDWDIGVAASWDADLFGRLRSGALAARADAEAQQAALDAVKVAVVADTVQAYVELCGATHGATVARDVAAAQEKGVALVAAQLDAGEVSPLELSQIRSLSASTRAAIAPFEAQQANARYRLGALQGRSPAEARTLSIACTRLPHMRSGVPVEDGTALLLRRPDIREVERKLAAAAARVGVARADLYPRLNLGGVLGLLAGDFSSVISPLATWAFPNQGPARAKLAQANAVERGALAQWNVVTLRALREVETALAAYDAEVRRNRDLATAATQSADYARRAAARVRLGDAAGLLQTDAERSLAAARLLHVQSTLAVAQAEVALFRALGGGWRNDPPAR